MGQASRGGRSKRATKTARRSKKAAVPPKRKRTRPLLAPQAVAGGAQVFISHPSDQVWIAKRMAQDIRRIGGMTFLDAAPVGDGSRLDSGDVIDERLRREMRRSQEVVVLLTPQSVTRPYIWLELGMAWMLKKKIVSVLHGITYDELKTIRGLPTFVITGKCITLDEFDNYVKELKSRIKGGKA